jgi:thiol-disulfide isomerase/thioredoxin
MRPVRLRSAALLTALLASTGCATGRPALVASPLVGKPVDLAAPDLQGREVSVSAARGRVRVVDFWATWCEPCQEQMPALDRLAKDLGGEGLAVYAISMDEDRAQVVSWLETNPVSFPVLWDRGGTRHAERLDVQRLPTTLVLDRAGLVRFVHQGYLPRNQAALEREVRQLLSEAGPP